MITPPGAPQGGIDPDNPPATTQDLTVDDGPPPRPREEDEEDELGTARERIAKLEGDLAQLMAQRDLENRLQAAGAIDVEAATILVRAELEKAQADSDGAPLSVEAAVEKLQSTRPFLFRQASSNGSAMAGMMNAGVDEIDRLADRARATGDRRTLLRYLRLRRGD